MRAHAERPVGKPRLRVYLRRSKADGDHQQFSLETQRSEAQRFVASTLPGRGVDLAWVERAEYTDEGISGDDFDRPGLVKLRHDVQRGDIIVCRDSTRLGRDGIELLLLVRTVVKERGARLFYTVTGQEVAFDTVLDQAGTFIQAIGGQMELDANRSRTREALRARVRASRIAGGKCYGYRNERRADGSGRPFTVAVVESAEADVVRRVYSEYVAGRGQKAIAIGLNQDRIPSPRAGRRGTGSWAPSCVRSMLLRERYKGVYVHGRVVRVKEGGKRVNRIAPASEWITVAIPDWRIIDEVLWDAAQETLAGRARDAKEMRKFGAGPAVRYALSGIARCGTCGGAIGSMRGRLTDGEPVAAYGCLWHHNRGGVVCPVKIRQSVDEVEAALAEHLRVTLLAPALLERVIASMRDELQRGLSTATTDTDAIEKELGRLRGERKNLLHAVRVDGGRVPELVDELRAVSDRIRMLESDLDAAKRTPAIVAGLMAQAEKAGREKLANLCAALESDREGARAVYRDLFPGGLLFKPAPNAPRRWAIEAVAHVGEKSPNCVATPTGFAQ